MGTTRVPFVPTKNLPQVSLFFSIRWRERHHQSSCCRGRKSYRERASERERESLREFSTSPDPSSLCSLVITEADQTPAMVSGGDSRLWSRGLLIECLLLTLLLSFGWRLCYGFRTFGFDMHQRFSDPVKGLLDVDDFELPEKGSVLYYAAMAHRDRAIHGRRLADDPTAPLTFSPGNETHRLNALGLYVLSLTVRKI